MSKMKGMQVIEVIFILIIMIIVTVVLINMFTNMMGSGKQQLSSQLNDIKQYHQGKEAVRICDGLCNDFKMTGSDNDAIDYCKQAVSNDMNNDGVIQDTDKGSSALFAIPVGQDEVCEEHIYCPMIGGSECKFGSRALTMQNCEETLCRYYMKSGLTAEEAAKKIDQIWNLGDCNIANDPNWAGWIGPLCGTNINLTGAKGPEQPGGGVNTGGNNGGNNGGGQIANCEQFCNGAVANGITYTGVTSDERGKMNVCVSFFSCAGSNEANNDKADFLDTPDDNNRQVPCETGEKGLGCCCAHG